MEHKKLHLKTIAVITVLFCFTSLATFSQTSFNWVVGMGGTSTDQAYAIDKDSNGNIYAVGSFSGTANFGVNFTSTGNTNGFIAKFDPSGNYVWAKHLAGNSTVRINDVKLDATGNIYMTGGFNNGADFDMGVGTASLVTSILTTFVLKLDPSGNYLWAKKFDPLPSALSNEGQAIECDASGNIYIAGEFNGIADFNPGAATYSLTSNGSADVYVTKLDPSGNFIWAKQFGGSSGDFVSSIYLDASANIYTTGSFQGTVDFDPGAGATIYTANNTDIYISKLTSNGAFVYAKQIGGSGIDRGGHVCSDATDNVYATGLFASSVDFDPGAGTYSLTATSTDIYILKLDASGNFSWANKFGAGSGAKIALNSSNDIFITGNYSGTSDFNPGVGTYNLSSNGGTDVFISRLDNNGNFISALSIGGTGADAGADMLLDSSGEIYLLGGYSATVDFNPFAGTYNMTSFGSKDPFLLKLNDCSAPTPPVNTTNISNQTICSGTTAVLTATSSGTVNWYATSTSTTVLSSGSSFTTPAMSAGTYTYYASAVTCTTSTSRTAITLTVNASPIITVNSGSICSGSSFTMSPSGASTYTFSGGSAIVSPTTNTSYSVTGTSAQGCISASPAISSVTVNALPTISVNSGSICSGSSFTMSPSGASTYTFSGGSAIVSPTTNTSYSVTGTSSQGCIASSSAISSVTVNLLPVISVNSGSICSGSSFTISPSGASTYTFSGGSAIVSPTANTSYSVTGTSAQGCISASSAISSVTVNSLPAISVNSGSICSGSSFTMSPSGASTYTFSGGSAIVSPTTNTSYSVTGTSAQGCIASSSAISSVTVNSLPVISVNSGSICSGSSFTMSPSGASTYTFSSGSAIVSPTANTSYSVTGTNAQGCISASSAISSVTVNSLPAISVNSGSICSGSSFTISPSGANTYTFSGGSAIVSPTTSSSYTVTGTSSNGCVSSAGAISNVSVNSLPNISATTNNTLICTGQTATLSASGASTYTWSNSQNTPNIVVSPTTTTTYTLSGTDINGCVNSAVITQSVSACTGLQNITNDFEISIYPNPNNGLFTINSTEKCDIEVIDILGSVISKQLNISGTQTMDISNHANGVYFIKIKINQEQVLIKRIVKQ